MKRKWVIGDIHGNYLGLKQVLEKANVQKGDTLILLGDLVDGGTDSYEVVSLLVELSKDVEVIFVKGNHDVWLIEFLNKKVHPVLWTQGGAATATSYIKNLDLDVSKDRSLTLYDIMLKVHEKIPKDHIDFFNSSVPYYLDEENMLYIHGGFDRFIPLEEQFEHEFYWNRSFLNQAMSAGKNKIQTVGDFKRIFLGHTSTLFWKEIEPINTGQIVWNLDTGAGSSGKVTIMDANKEYYYQSDSVQELYGFRSFIRN